MRLSSQILRGHIGNALRQNSLQQYSVYNAGNLHLEGPISMLPVPFISAHFNGLRRNALNLKCDRIFSIKQAIFNNINGNSK